LDPALIESKEDLDLESGTESRKTKISPQRMVSQKIEYRRKPCLEKLGVLSEDWWFLLELFFSFWSLVKAYVWIRTQRKIPFSVTDSELIRSRICMKEFRYF
jgi:hypothetical protein